MITIDDRTGSKDLHRYLPNATLGKLTYADVSFPGRGPDRAMWLIGVERKTIGDLLNSITTGRLSGHQLGGLMNAYHVVYLIVEGIWRTNPKTGFLETRAGKGWRQAEWRGMCWTGAQVMGYLNTLAVVCGMHIIQTLGPRETAETISILHSWWSKGWEEHKAHLKMHKAAKREKVGFAWKKPSLLRRVAAELPGIGWERSEAVEKAFGSVERMLEASEKEWRQVPGIGKKIAGAVYEELRRNWWDE